MRKSCTALMLSRSLVLIGLIMLLMFLFGFDHQYWMMPDTNNTDSRLRNDEASLRDALQQVQAAGFQVCVPDGRPIITAWGLPHCMSLYSRVVLQDEDAPPLDDDAESTWGYVMNGLCALACVCIAAMAAGLTLGMLGLDPLLLLIKERAAVSLEERKAASKLLPLVSQHHRLLVTLLLMNAVANESLPIFLEKLIPPTLAILVSVTLVLFFGEIIPSAVFTGPNQLKIASSLVPVVKTVLWIFYPIASPIAKLLDWLLHDMEENDDMADGEHRAASSAAYTRGELAALIRIQYEERLAAKRRRKERCHGVVGGDHVGALDFTPPLALSNSQSVRAVKNQITHGEELVVAPAHPTAAVGTANKRGSGSIQDGATIPAEYYFELKRRGSDSSIHADEVMMVEGALQMQTKVAMDVFTPMRKVFSIPSDMLLSERNMVKIYSMGFTRVPVHEPGLTTAIVGILMTKLLIVVNPKDKRPVNTLPLRCPRCVSPAMPLVDLLNMLQSGGKGSKGGHLALVCANPSTGEKALAAGDSLPETAGLMGIITLEDVLEMLLQEQIYDEMDKRERQAHRLARLVVRRWKRYVRMKKEGKPLSTDIPAMLPVVERAVAAKAACRGSPAAAEEGLASADSSTETTALLKSKPEAQKYSS